MLNGRVENTANRSDEVILIRKTCIIIFLFILPVVISSQVKTELFPSELNFQPLAANTLEPKLGFLFHLDDNHLRLDVSNSMDVYRIQYENNSILTFGADLFTYSRLRSEDNFKFPVEAIDYLFGLNAAYKITDGNDEIGMRLRLAHISAHLVDGRYEKDNNSWLDGKLPFVYSKEFIEVIGYYKYSSLRLYLGATYNYNIAPGLLGKDNYQIGFDYFHLDWLSENITPFVGYDLRLMNLDEYTYNHNFNAGLKIGKRESKGLSLFFNYYSGRSIHGELFDQTVTYTAFGINFDI